MDESKKIIRLMERQAKKSKYDSTHIEFYITGKQIYSDRKQVPDWLQAWVEGEIANGHKENVSSNCSDFTVLNC